MQSDDELFEKMMNKTKKTQNISDEEFNQFLDWLKEYKKENAIFFLGMFDPQILKFTAENKLWDIYFSFLYNTEIKTTRTKKLNTERKGVRVHSS